jgi:hypothetical protein
MLTIEVDTILPALRVIRVLDSCDCNVVYHCGSSSIAEGNSL